MSLQNVYYERKVGTARPCYVCNRPTQTVLATLKTDDFLYTCESHLGDPGFVTLIPATGPSAEDIRKVIAEYGAREARRTAVAEKKKEDEDKDKEKKDEKKDESKSMLGSIASAAVGAASSAASAAVSSFTAKDEKKSPTSSKPSSPAPGSPSTPPMAGVPSVPAQTHKKYALHRTFFEARKATHISRQNTARAKEVSKGMPQVPRGF